MRTSRLLARMLASLALGTVLHAAPATGADLQVTLPHLIVPPGASVIVHLDTPPGPAGLGVFSAEFVMPLDPAVIQSSAVELPGYLQFWGPPFVNNTSSIVAGAAAGLTPITGTNVRMCSVRLTVKPSAVSGTVMPLTFSSLRLNEGTPSVAFTAGSITVSSALAVPGGPDTPGLLLSAPRPQPARGMLRTKVTLADPGRLRVTLLDLNGRTVRELATGEHAAGEYPIVWNGRGADGTLLPSGLYFLRAESSDHVSMQRVVWIR